MLCVLEWDLLFKRTSKSFLPIHWLAQMILLIGFKGVLRNVGFHVAETPNKRGGLKVKDRSMGIYFPEG